MVGFVDGVGADEYGNVNLSAARITSVWHSGESWYRVWSDGFIQQGGFCLFSNTNGTKVVTLPKAFSSFEYGIAVSNDLNDDTHWYSTKVWRSAKSSFTITAAQTCYGVSWIASGY